MLYLVKIITRQKNDAYDILYCYIHIFIFVWVRKEVKRGVEFNMNIIQKNSKFQKNINRSPAL